MPAYYPSVVVNLRLRFDEALHTSVSLALPLDEDEAASVASTSSDQLIARGDLPALLAGQRDVLSSVLNIVPTTCHVELPGYRQAGKFSMTFPFRDLPIDPDIIRAVGVEIYAGTVSPGDFGAGNTQPPQPGLPRRSQVSPGAIVSGGELALANLERSPATELLVGTVDVHRVEHDETGDRVTLEGRDLRGVLLDLYVRPDALAKLPLAQPIDRVVKKIVDSVPVLRAVVGSSGGGVIVEASPDDWPGGKIPAPGAADDVTRVNLGAAGLPPNTGAGEGGAPVPMPTGEPSKIKLWDIVTQYCALVGAVPYFVGRRLRIRPVRALYDPNKRSGFDPRFPTPFAGGRPRTIKGESGQDVETSVRVLAYGRDVAKLRTERKLGGQKVPTVEVVSLDTNPKTRGLGRLLREQWPPPVADEAAGVTVAMAQKAKSTTVSPSGALVQTDKIQVFIPGIRSRQRLLEIARDTYEEIGRGEVGGSCSTKDLASLGGDASDPDLLRLRPGDPVRFVVDARSLRSYPPATSELQDFYRKGPEALAEELGRRLGNATLGRVLAYSMTGRVAERQKVYRVSGVRFSWDAAKGIGIDFDFQNYIESRAGITTLRTKNNQRRPATAVRP